MKNTLGSHPTLHRIASKLALGIGVLIFLTIGLGPRAHAAGPSFTFSGTVPSQVVAGQSFEVTASITDIGDPAADYNSYFQIYDQDFHYLNQTYYTDQSFLTGQTLDYNATLTAPTTPGFYYVAGLMFNQDYSSGIVSQDFFGNFNVVPASTPEPVSGVELGLVLTGMLCFKSLLVRKLIRQTLPIKPSKLMHFIAYPRSNDSQIRR